MNSTEATERTTPTAPAAPAPPVKQRVRRAVSPEIAALVREEDEALGATIAVANAVAQAAVDAANATIAAARTRQRATLRAILKQLELHEADFIGYDGYGADTVLLLDVPAPPEN